MPRSRRKMSGSGLHHVVIKGDGGQILFENDANRVAFIRMLERFSEQFAIEVHAYCLMDNHVHLLIRDNAGNLSLFMKSLEERYAQFICAITGRVGHVFQGRFWSEPVETDSRYLATMRYIHANPEVAGMCAAHDYLWSSYRAFVGEKSFVYTQLALGMLDGPAEFEHFQRSGSRFAKPYPQCGLRRHLSMDELHRIACELLGRDSLEHVKSLPAEGRSRVVSRLFEAGFTEREIARLTGLGQSTIHRALV